jgi:hypothetical protein
MESYNGVKWNKTQSIYLFFILGVTFVVILLQKIKAQYNFLPLAFCILLGLSGIIGGIRGIFSKKAAFIQNFGPFRSMYAYIFTGTTGVIVSVIYIIFGIIASYFAVISLMSPNFCQVPHFC